MKKFLYEWWYVIVLLFCLIMILTGMAFAIANTIKNDGMTEGMVMNKWISPAYRTCDDDGCRYQSTKYVIAVQYGEQKDWWYVTESYYDSVKIGEWVTK